MADNLNCQWQYQEVGSQKRTAAFQAAVLLNFFEQLFTEDTTSVLSLMPPFSHVHWYC